MQANTHGLMWARDNQISPCSSVVERYPLDRSRWFKSNRGPKAFVSNPLNPTNTTLLKYNLVTIFNIPSIEVLVGSEREGDRGGSEPEGDGNAELDGGLPPRPFRPELVSSCFQPLLQEDWQIELHRKGNFHLPLNALFTCNPIWCQYEWDSFHWTWKLNVVAECRKVRNALLACGYGASFLQSMDRRLFELGIIPTLPNPESSRVKCDFTLVKLETLLLNLSAGFKQSVGVLYFMSYPSECGHRIYLR